MMMMKCVLYYYLEPSKLDVVVWHGVGPGCMQEAPIRFVCVTQCRAYKGYVILSLLLPTTFFFFFFFHSQTFHHVR